ncbi:membrane progestin receptor gamma isoform X3 [Hemicordylus capensis]|uniref:membrane progestin receptor gamma isoform X3 n=1 Tax=Hemicordylus capensis TaxID=884348 RepID=UPI002304AAEE|nr:membrane progestin receptor gamma isoform X3 [Hemicordylus capensis]
MHTLLSLKLPRLLNINQVPKVFRERGILFGYRHPRSSATDCIFSVFQMTNETVNIWTHFLPAWYFLWKLLAWFCTQDVWDDRYTWPFLAYMVTCCIYPLTSSAAHTFSTMSSRARHICYFLDYGALTLYSLGSAVAYSAYVFPEEWLGNTFHHYYVTIAVLNTIIGTTLACYSRYLWLSARQNEIVLRCDFAIHCNNRRMAFSLELSQTIAALLVCSEGLHRECPPNSLQAHCLCLADLLPVCYTSARAAGTRTLRLLWAQPPALSHLWDHGDTLPNGSPSCGHDRPA